MVSIPCWYRIFTLGWQNDLPARRSQIHFHFFKRLARKQATPMISALSACLDCCYYVIFLRGTLAARAAYPGKVVVSRRR